MKQLLILCLLALPFCAISQDDSALFKIPYIDNNLIVYEKVFFLDSMKGKDKIFNAVKAALIKSTNYKSAKVDEDRTSGNITTNISFQFLTKPGIIKIVLDARCQMSIDIKENRFRIRLTDHTASMFLMGEKVTYSLVNSYLSEMDKKYSNKWKPAKSVAVPWHDQLTMILNGFPSLINQGLSDDF